MTFDYKNGKGRSPSPRKKKDAFNFFSLERGKSLQTRQSVRLHVIIITTIIILITSTINDKKLPKISN